MGGTNERGLLIRGFGVSEILVSLATIRTTEVSVMPNCPLFFLPGRRDYPAQTGRSLLMGE